jgi:hypothetical protein
MSKRQKANRLPAGSRLVASYNSKINRWEIRIQAVDGALGNLWHGPYRFLSYTQCRSTIERFERAMTNG